MTPIISKAVLMTTLFCILCMMAICSMNLTLKINIYQLKAQKLKPEWAK